MTTKPSLISEDLEHVVQRTAGLWPEISGQRLFLTGGTGFFGKWFLETFLWANEHLKLNAHVTVLSRNPQRLRQTFAHLFTSPSVTWLEGDILNFKFPSGNFTHIIHGATDVVATQDAKVLRGILDVCDLGTRRILDFAKSCGAKKILLTSSGAVYGRQPPTLSQIPENFSGAPDISLGASAYGEGKRVAELLCQLAHQEGQVQVKIARGFAFLGPYMVMDGHFAAGNFLLSAAKGHPIEIQGDGTPMRSYLYASDLMIWLWTILFKGRSGGVYNVGSNQEISILGLAQNIAQSSDKKLEVIVRKTPGAALPERYVPSVECAQRELGLEITVNLSQAVRKTLLWMQNGGVG